MMINDVARHIVVSYIKVYSNERLEYNETNIYNNKIHFVPDTIFYMLCSFLLSHIILWCQHAPSRRRSAPNPAVPDRPPCRDVPAKMRKAGSRLLWGNEEKEGKISLV